MGLISRASLRKSNQARPSLVVRAAIDEHGNTYSGVQVQENGQILKNGRVAKQTISPDGYHSVSVKHPSKGHTSVHVHRLVALAFCSNDDAENKVQVDHLGSKSDNDYSSLEWVTPSENIRRSYATGKKTIATHTLTDDDAIEIRRLSAQGMTNTAIAKRFGVARQTVRNILAYDTHFLAGRDPDFPPRQLSEEVVLMCLGWRAMGYDLSDFAMLQGISRRQLRDALANKDGKWDFVHDVWQKTLRYLATGHHLPIWRCDDDLVIDDSVFARWSRRQSVLSIDEVIARFPPA